MNIGINYLASLSHFVPEMVCVVTMVGLLFLESTYSKSDGNRSLLYGFSYLGLLGAAYALILNLNTEPTGIFYNAVVIDPFGTLLKIVIVLGTFCAIYLSRQSVDIYKSLKAEFAILAVGVLIGGMLLISANNMLTLYIGIETLSIISYVMAALKRNNDHSSEAGLKYSLYGGISAGMMLFGMSHIFGVLGTIQFSGLSEQLANIGSTQYAILIPSFLLFFVGLGYKIAAAPFHMWSPDVYEGSPIPVTAFFAIVPKLAGIAAVLRVTLVFFGEPGVLQYGWVAVLMLIAAVTMTVGNVSAIGQKSIKRMLAYSSISHAGTMLLGVTVIDDLGTRSILFYAITYLFMTMVAFFIVSFVSDRYGNDHFERFNGLIYRYPVMAVALGITMFSLAGVPPLSGFVAKFNIISAIVNKKFYVLAIIAVLNSVVSLYYYLKLVRLMVFKPVESNDNIEGFNFVNQAFVVGLSIPVILLGIYWNKIISLTSESSILIQ